MSKLLVGVGREIITPEIGTDLAGYAARPSTSVHDDLHATVFAFDTDGTKALLVSIDMCNLKADGLKIAQAAVAEASGLPLTQIIIACTHTHSGPSCFNIPFMKGIFTTAVQKAIKTAMANMKPAQMGIGTTLSDIAVNRRQIQENGKITLGQNPYGTYDPTMSVISFREPDGTPIGNIIHYGCHNTAAGRNPEITRDWCGVAVDRLEYLSGAVTCFINGCGGDCGPRLSNGKTSGLNNISYALEHGGRAALDAIRAWKNIQFWHDAPLSVVSEDIDLPLRVLPPVEEMRKRTARYEAMESMNNIQKGTYDTLMSRIRFVESGKEQPMSKPIPTNLICIGPLALLPIPFEPFSTITLRIKDHSPYPYTICVGYANGSESYFPSIDQIPRGGYEVDMFIDRNLIPYADHAEQSFVEGSLRMLRIAYDEANTQQLASY